MRRLVFCQRFLIFFFLVLRAPPPKQKVVDKEAIFQLLLHADRKDYERICIKYGISDFRGMLRALQELRRDSESEQAKVG